MPKVTSNSPGSVLLSFLDDYHLNPTKLAKEIKLSQSAVRQISIDKTKISVPVSLRLAKYFGNTPEFWLDLQLKRDLEEAANDKSLAAVLKAIPKAVKPAPDKAAPAKEAVKPVKQPAKAAKKPAPKAPGKPQAGKGKKR
jgi:addiction module HigA family antidote